MNTPESISQETHEQFPIGSLVKLSPKGAKFTPKRWHERQGRVVGHSVGQWRGRVHNHKQGTMLSVTERSEVMLLVVWEGRTRRRICRRHRSDFVLLPAQSEERGQLVGGPE